jgi:hypothetical protein
MQTPVIPSEGKGSRSEPSPQSKDLFARPRHVWLEKEFLHGRVRRGIGPWPLTPDH